MVSDGDTDKKEKISGPKVRRRPKTMRDVGAEQDGRRAGGFKGVFCEWVEERIANFVRQSSWSARHEIPSFMRCPVDLGGNV